MARHTLGRAVLRHFAQAPAWPALAGCESLDELQDAFAGSKRAERQRVAAYFNTLTVLDPTVGSGHFLVNALSELLAKYTDNGATATFNWSQVGGLGQD